MSELLVVHGIKCRETDLAIISEVWDVNVYEDRVQVHLGDVVVDAGAHIGSFTMKVVDRARKVIAFEPGPDNFELLRLNTEPYKNVEIHQKALWSKSGKAKLYHNKLSVGGWSLIPLAPKITDYQVEVEMVRLDDVITEGVDFIKMDIEGCEIEALRGAKKILEAYHPVIVMEAHPLSPAWWNELRGLLSGYNIKGFPSSEKMWQRRIIIAI